MMDDFRILRKNLKRKEKRKNKDKEKKERKRERKKRNGRKESMKWVRKQEILFLNIPKFFFYIPEYLDKYF